MGNSVAAGIKCLSQCSEWMSTTLCRCHTASSAANREFRLQGLLEARNNLESEILEISTFVDIFNFVWLEQDSSACRINNIVRTVPSMLFFTWRAKISANHKCSLYNSVAWLVRWFGCGRRLLDRLGFARFDPPATWPTTSLFLLDWFVGGEVR